MKKWIEDLFKFPRTLSDLRGALDYIRTIIPLTVIAWDKKEDIILGGNGKCWTWDIPEGGILVGEHTIEGKSDETIILPIHLDHPKMANDNLSGVAVAIRLAQSITNPKYTYKFLFLPETIGTTAYLSGFGTKWLKYGIVIDSVGTDGDLITTLPKTPSLLPFYISGKTNEFFSDAHLWSGNDERVLESVNIPSIQISRSPFLEYHSEKDTPKIIDERQLEEALKYVISIIYKIELDFVPVPKYQGVPCLSANGLWKKEYESPHTFMKVERIWQSLGHGLSVAQIAQLHNLSFDFVYNFIMEMKEKNLC